MLAFIALVVAAIAIFIANKALRRIEVLERALGTSHPQPAVLATPPVSAPQPQQPAPVHVEPHIPIYQPPPPPPPAQPVPPPTQQPSNPATQQPFQPPPPPHPPTPVLSIDWENLVGIKLFSWIAGIALVLSAVFLFKYSVDHGWLRPPIRAGFGLLSGIALLIVCELRIARNYRFTANAMDGAGIAILYATLFSMHARWQLVPSWVAFLGMLVVTAAAVFLSTRRDSVFIALLGLIGGFATPALLSSGENRPIALFSYLLLLNGGISWIAFRKRWPLLTALSMLVTVIYQWAWVEKFLTTGQLPLAAGIFVAFAVVGATALWPRGTEDDRQPLFRRIAAAAAVIPLIFAFFTAIVPEYGAHYNVLFGFLLLMTGGLTAVALLRGPEWLHSVGGVATLVTWFIWLTASYTRASWPWTLVWLAVFIALYLAADLKLRNRAVHTASLLFFVFVGLAIREPLQDNTLIGAMLTMLTVIMVFAIMRAAPAVAALAIGLSSVAVMVMDPGPRVDLGTQLLLLLALMAIAWLFERHFLLLLAVPMVSAVIYSADIAAGDVWLAYGAVLFAPFFLFALIRGRRATEWPFAHLAAALMSIVFFFAAAYGLTLLKLTDWHGVLAAFTGLLFVALFWREEQRSRLLIVSTTALAYLTAAIPLQFDESWTTILFALEAAALVWLYRRIAHRGLLLWSTGLAVVVLLRFIVNSVPESYALVYLVSAAAMFAAAYLVTDETLLRRLFATCATLELFFLLNVAIADYYWPGRMPTFNFTSSSLAQDLTYTFGWALFAITMLVAGLVVQSRGARVAALGLLLVTILKCFLHDLAKLGGLYRVASLFGLAVCLVAVGLMLQKFVMMKRESQQQIG